jgi:hypothetical protein
MTAVPLPLSLQGLGANVTVHGANWNAADVVARARVAADPEAA